MSCTEASRCPPRSRRQVVINSFHWFLPTTGDGATSPTSSRRPGDACRLTPAAPTSDYLGQVARAAEEAGSPPC